MDEFNATLEKIYKFVSADEIEERAENLQILSDILKKLAFYKRIKPQRDLRKEVQRNVRQRKMFRRRVRVVRLLRV